MATEVEIKTALDQLWREHGDEIKAGTIVFLRTLARLTDTALKRVEGVPAPSERCESNTPSRPEPAQ